jgi:hypothetical protein
MPSPPLDSLFTWRAQNQCAMKSRHIQYTAIAEADKIERTAAMGWKEQMI